MNCGVMTFLLMLHFTGLHGTEIDNPEDIALCFRRLLVVAIARARLTTLFLETSYILLS